MGQYWKVVNLDKREFINPHKLGSGLKLWEQVANHPGTGAALIILCAAMPEARGGGDLDMDANWHGPERDMAVHNITPGPMPEAYPAIAKRTIGRWAGNRITLIGDYAEPGDLEIKDGEPPANLVYHLCCDAEDGDDPEDSHGFARFTDVSEDVARVIEHELHGAYEGKGWKHFKPLAEPA